MQLQKQQYDYGKVNQQLIVRFDQQIEAIDICMNQ